MQPGTEPALNRFASKPLALRYDFSDRLAQWNALVPFSIQLRNFAERDLPDPADFVKQLGRHLGDKMPLGWVSELMDSGLALLLIDGVDELSSKQRITVRRLRS